MGPCTQGGLYLVVRVECGTSKLDMGGGTDKGRPKHSAHFHLYNYQIRRLRDVCAGGVLPFLCCLSARRPPMVVRGLGPCVSLSVRGRGRHASAVLTKKARGDRQRHRNALACLFFCLLAPFW